MIKNLFLFAVLMVGLRINAYTQQRSTGSNVPQPASTSYTAADTVQALHRMFSADRAKGGFLTGISAVALVVSPLMLGNSTDDQPTKHGNLGGFVAFGVGTIFLAPVAVYGLSKVLSSSKKREQKVISAYTEKRILRKKYQNALKPRYFISTPQTDK